MPRSRIVVVGVGIVLLAPWVPAFAAPSTAAVSPIEGTDLSVRFPDGWVSRPVKHSPEDVRFFVEQFPVMAEQVGLRASSTDGELARAWKRLMRDAVHTAFDPRDGDAVTIFVSTNPFWPSLAAWRADQKAHARSFSGKLVAVDERVVGSHTAFTSIIRTGNRGFLVGTAAIEQPDGRFVIVSATLDSQDRRLTERILAGVSAA